jgi:DNA-binding NarL/FixJ family response regulator
LNIPAPARPRVLLADDNLDFLESVSRFLAPTFDIVAAATGGREALGLARRLRPDVIVLDVAMPGFNGFETLDQLRRDRPDSRVVFLTMYRDDDFVVAAINAGAYGYVLKSRFHLDLIGAIGHVLAGRLFVPSLTSLSTVAGNGHTVHFHTNDSQFLDELAHFIGTTLRSREQLALIACEATRMGVAERLQARQMNPAMLAERGQYFAQDSVLALSKVLHAGKPIRESLEEIIHGVERFRLAGPNGPRGRLTIVGDMSASLCLNGDFEAAVEVERLWSELTRRLPFFTVCLYPIDCIDHSEHGHHLANVCAAHSAVTSAIFGRRSRDIS